MEEVKDSLKQKIRDLEELVLNIIKFNKVCGNNEEFLKLINEATLTLDWDKFELIISGKIPTTKLTRTPTDFSFKEIENFIYQNLFFSHHVIFRIYYKQLELNLTLILR